MVDQSIPKSCSADAKDANVCSPVDTKVLESWHHIAYDEYKNTFFTLRNKQLDITKTYLWVCSALLTFEFYLCNEAFGNKINLAHNKPDSLFVLLQFSSIIVAGLAFSFCIRLMRVKAEKGEKFPFSFKGDGPSSLSYFSGQTYSDYFSGNITSLHESIRTERQIIQYAGINLRRVCTLLLASFWLQITAALWLFTFSSCLQILCLGGQYAR